MKIKTKTTRGEIYFAYSDYYGNLFGTWHDLAMNGNGTCYLVGYFRSYYAGCTEEIDEMFLPGRPTIGMIRRFIQGCKDCINAE